MDERIKMLDLLTAERLAVLATHCDGQPYASLVAYAVSDDLKTIGFVTPSGTRKYDNMQSDSRVAMLIHSRQTGDKPFEEGTAVTAVGSARAMPKNGELFARYLNRYSELREFADDEKNVFFGIEVDRYVFVDHFQHVTEIKP